MVRSGLFLFAMLLFAVSTFAQDRRAQLGIGGGSYTLFGDLLVNEGKEPGVKPLVYEVVVNNIGGLPAARQIVHPGGRYQFMNLAAGQYELVVLLEHEEVARTRVEILAGPTQERVRQDITLAWKPGPPAKSASISAADFYKRSESNERLFLRAKQATDQKRYDDSITALKELVTADPRDFQAWTELGTVYLFKQDYDESEKIGRASCR